MRLFFTTALVAGLAASPAMAVDPASDTEIAKVVADHIGRMVPANGRGGIAAAVRIGGRSLFFNYGVADTRRKQPVTSDSLFNLGSLAKTFDSVLLAQAVLQKELSLDEPVATYVTELQEGGDIRHVTFGQLASHTSGFALPQDNPPWPRRFFTLPQFIADLNRWKPDRRHKPGKKVIYSHAGYMLLHLALERRFGTPFGQLMEERLLKPLGLSSTTMPVASADPKGNPRGEIPPSLAGRAVQGYSSEGERRGPPAELQGFYLWLGTGQMYASASDMAVYLAANLGELPDNRLLQEAMQLTQQRVVPIKPGTDQAMAWEVQIGGNPHIVDKYGGLGNASAYIGMMTDRKLGIVLLGNRADLDVEAAGRAIMSRLAGLGSTH